MPASVTPSVTADTRTDSESMTPLLLVEDDPAFSYVLRRQIEEQSRESFRVEMVDCLEKALAQLRLGGYGCILLDLHLPDSRGMATFHQVRYAASDLPIVVLTGLDDREMAVQAVREGAQDYLVKGSVDGLLLVRSIRYAIERHGAQEKWRTLSLEDDLTGIYNRRGFLALAEQQLKLARRRKVTQLVLFVDLDGLKQINDNLGHEAGNRALCEAAEVLRESFRETDVVARMGGDEFVVLLEDVDRESFRNLERRLADRISRVNENQSGEGDSGPWGREFQLSMSWGTALFDPRRPRTLEELIREADHGMYRAKRRKREME